MQYRDLCGNQVSVLGYGAMRLPTQGRKIDRVKAMELFNYAIDHGVNYIDTAYPYHGGDSEVFLGENILSTPLREKVYIATKLPIFNIRREDKLQETFDVQLDRLKVDYVDYYLLHSLNGLLWDKAVEINVIPFMDRIKAEGKVKHMGFSFHGKAAEFKHIIDAYDWDFVQIQYNYLDENYQAGKEGLLYAASKAIPVVVMEPIRGGALANVPEAVKKVLDRAAVKRSPAAWAFQWVYDHPEVATVLSGMNCMEHLQENIKVASDSAPNSLTAEDKMILDQAKIKFRELYKVGCTACGYCMPCPAGIDIPGSFQYWNNFHMFGKGQARMMHMMSAGIMTEDGKSHFTNVCIDCGACEKKCPQQIAVRQEFKGLQRDLEGPVIRAVSGLARVFFRRKKE